MKRSSFLATLAGLLTFLGFKKKPKWDYGHVSTELEPLKWSNKGTYHLNDVLLGEIEFGPKVEVAKYVNESHFDLSAPRKLQACFPDIATGKYYVHESIDNGLSWAKVREYDLKDMIATATPPTEGQQPPQQESEQ